MTPYGVYDVAANAGWGVSVGTNHDTAAFPVQTVRTGRQKAGQPANPGATAAADPRDGGGSNEATAPGCGRPSWRRWLRDRPEITVRHLPLGTSKWNKIEHRLFSDISTNWRGRPLTSHEVIEETIAATTTRTGRP